MTQTEEKNISQTQLYWLSSEAAQQIGNRMEEIIKADIAGAKDKPHKEGYERALEAVKKGVQVQIEQNGQTLEQIQIKTPSDEKKLKLSEVSGELRDGIHDTIQEIVSAYAKNTLKGAYGGTESKGPLDLAESELQKALNTPASNSPSQEKLAK
jgi:hypothetical protein